MRCEDGPQIKELSRGNAREDLDRRKQSALPGVSSGKNRKRRAVKIAGYFDQRGCYIRGKKIVRIWSTPNVALHAKNT